MKRSIRGLPVMRWIQKYRVPVIAVVCVVLSFSLRFYHLDFRSIWMDEERQAQIAGSGFDLGMAGRAAGQHQPPIDYYLEAVGISIFGKTEIGARIHAAVMGALSVLLFLCLLRQHFKGQKLVYVSAVLFLFDVFHIRYSQEGRPIATGVFGALFYVTAVFNWMKENSFGRQRILDVTVLFAANVFLLLSVGLQPIPFLAASSMALLPGMFIRSLRRRVAATWLIALASLLVCYPIISLSISEGGSYLGDKSLMARLGALVHALPKIGKATWSLKLKEIFHNYQPMAMLLAVPGIAGIVRSWIERQDDRLRLLSTYAVLFVVVFPPVFDVLFVSQINYNIKPRYFATYQPMLFLCLSVLIYHSFILMRFLPPLTAKWGTRGLYALFALFFVFSFVQNGAKLIGEYENHSTAGWRQLYAFFREEGNTGDVAYMMNLNRFGRLDPFFHAIPFYYKKKDSRPVALRNTRQLLSDYEKDRIKNKSLFIVTAYGNDNLSEVYFRGIENVRYRAFPSLAVIQVTNIVQTSDIKDVFRIFVERLTPHAENFRAFYILAKMLLHDGEENEAEDIIGKLSALDKNRRFQKEIVGALRSELREKK